MNVFNSKMLTLYTIKNNTLLLINIFLLFWHSKNIYDKLELRFCETIKYHI